MKSKPVDTSAISSAYSCFVSEFLNPFRLRWSKPSKIRATFAAKSRLNDAVSFQTSTVRLFLVVVFHLLVLVRDLAEHYLAVHITVVTCTAWILESIPPIFVVQ